MNNKKDTPKSVCLFISVHATYDVCQTMRRPWMRFMTIRMTAMTRRIWRSPPRVYEDTSPKNQRMTKMMMIVHIVFHLFSSEVSLARM